MSVPRQTKESSHVQVKPNVISTLRGQSVQNWTRHAGNSCAARDRLEAVDHRKPGQNLPPDSVLSGLPAELLEGLFVKARTLLLAADQILFLAGEEGDGCYRIQQGLLKASIAEPGGSERILAVLGPESIVGELSMIDSAPRSASVVALRDSKLSFVNRSTFQAFGKTRPELYEYLTTLLAQRLRCTNDTVAATSFLSYKGRVARILLNLADEFGRDAGKGRIVIEQKLSQDDLAAMAGTARETVSRALHDWADRSLVRRLAGYYYLEDRARLKTEAEDYVPSRQRATPGVRQMRNHQGQ